MKGIKIIFFIELVGIWKLYGVLLERKYEDIYFFCFLGKLLGEDEICYLVFVEGIVKSILDIIFICYVLK